MADPAPLTVGILVFDGVDDLDVVGPWEVFCTARTLKQPIAPYLVAETAGSLRSGHGMEFKPTVDFPNAPRFDAVLVPGGPGSRDDTKGLKPEVLAWIKSAAASASWITSVCAGALVLARLGLLDGKRATTYWFWIDRFRADYPRVQVVDSQRVVHDGNVVTCAGVTAGLDLAFYLLGRWFGPDVSRKVQRAIQYDPEPPFRET